MDHREELIEFVSNRYEDIELRSKDEFAISYIDDVPIVIQNFEVAQYWIVNTKLDNTTLGVVIAVIALIVLIFIGVNT